MFGLDKEWAPVVAGLVGSLLTGLFGLGLLWLQNRHAKKAAAAAALSATYGELLARSFAFARRIDAFGLLKQQRSGWDEQREVVLGRRKPLDLIELYEWLDKDLGPLGDVLARVHLIGSQAAVTAADAVISASTSYMDAALATVSDQRWPARLFAKERRSPEQTAALQEATNRFFRAREACARVARNELGAKAVLLPIERNALERSKDHASKPGTEPTP